MLYFIIGLVAGLLIVYIINVIYYNYQMTKMVNDMGIPDMVRLVKELEKED